LELLIIKSSLLFLPGGVMPAGLFCHFLCRSQASRVGAPVFNQSLNSSTRQTTRRPSLIPPGARPADTIPSQLERDIPSIFAASAAPTANGVGDGVTSTTAHLPPFFQFVGSALRGL
jgi:hypothetical protein